MKKLILLFILSLTVFSQCFAQAEESFTITQGKDANGFETYYVSKTVTETAIRINHSETTLTVVRRTFVPDTLNYVDQKIPEDAQVEAYLKDSSNYSKAEVWSHYDWKKLWLSKHQVFQYTTAVFDKNKKTIESFISQKEDSASVPAIEIICIFIAVFLAAIYLGVAAANVEKTKKMKKKTWLRLVSLVIVAIFAYITLVVISNIVPGAASVFSTIMILGATGFILFDSTSGEIISWTIGITFYGVLIVGIITKSILLGLSLVIFFILITYLTFCLIRTITSIVEKIKTIIKITNKKS
jgi:hypothetical protein